MKLYYFKGACSLADHIVLEWTGLPYQTVRMSLESVKSPEYLALNPNGTVPLLIDGELLLTQNAAILCYLAEQHPGLQLLGDGSCRSRAEVMEWLSFLNSDVHVAFKPVFNPRRILPDPAHANAIAETARAHVRTLFGRIDKQLAGRDWLTNQRSVADPYLFVMTRWAVRLNVGVDGLGNVLRFAERMYADAGVQKAIRAEEDAIELAA
jgi:glutathione S-transferase